MNDKKVEESCCEDENMCSIGCAPKKKNETNKINNCDCGGCCQ